MAVIQISKIQVRRGLEENLPQLAGGEFGWSVDTQRLYIGNGTVSEGAPEVGNTEVVTAGRDILSVIRSYTFKGTESGYTSQTGASALSPIQRSFQEKLDDHISARDFGAVGDGSTDDTVALQRAINQVFPRNYYDTVGVRRILHIPAGVYITTANLTIPPYAVITGDGLARTVIRKSSGSDPVIQFRDSVGNIGATMTETASSDLPFNIEIEGLTLESTIGVDVALVDSSTDITFSKVEFKGNSSQPFVTGTEASGLKLISSVDATTYVTVDECQFKNIEYGITAIDSIRAVNATNCLFGNLYQGVVLSANTSSPKNIKITSSMFDNIAKEALFVGDDSSMISAYNYFKSTVGAGDESLLVSDEANTSVISWNSASNYSIGDIFDRDAANIALHPTINIVGTGEPATAISIASGSTLDLPGRTETLSTNTAVAANTSLTFTSNTTSIIDYQIVRGDLYRTGTIKVSQSGGTAIFEDDYSESSDTGVNISFQGFGSEVVMTYTTTSDFPYSDATFKYNLRSFI